MWRCLLDVCLTGRFLSGFKFIDDKVLDLFHCVGELYFKFLDLLAIDS